MVISGIDGVGKSALSARFAEGVVADLPLLWFDFDRADLAPDDAVSLVAALAEQADLQLDVFKPAPLDSVEGPT